MLAGCAHVPVKPAAGLTSTAGTYQCQSPQQCAELHFMLSDLKLHDNDLNGAIGELRTAASYDSSSPYLYILLARLTAEEQSYKEALGYVDKALVLDPVSVQALYTKADILSGTGYTEQSIRILRQVVKLSPQSENAYITLALTQYHADDTPGAEKTLDAMAEHLPRSPYPYYYRAKIEVDKKHYTKAIAYYDKAFAASPDFYTALYEEADIYAYLKSYNKAAAAYNRILAGNPDAYSLYEKLGDLYLTARKYPEALKNYRKAEHYVPSIVLQLKIAMIYVETQDYDHAEAAFKSIIQANPSFYRAYYYYGLLLAETKKYDQARAILRKIPMNDDMYTSAQEEIAVIYSQQDNNKEAESVLFPVLQREPTPEHYNLFASFLVQDKQYQQAIDFLNTALNKFTDSQSLLYHLGVVYDQNGEQKKALSVMEQILTVNAKNPDALNYIGYTYADKGIKLDTAETMIKKALAVKPGDGYITDSLGWVYYKKGLVRKAIITLRKAVKLSNDDPQILEHLGDAYLKAGNRQSAIKTYKAAVGSKQLTDEKLKQKLQGKLLKLGAR